MSNQGIPANQSYLSVELPDSLTTSPSVSTFMPEEDASMCPLLGIPTTPSPPLDFTHPLTPSTNGNEVTTDASELLLENLRKFVNISSYFFF